MIFEPQNSDEPAGFFFGLGRNFANDRLLLRVNPALALDLRLQAGNCHVQGVEGPIHADVQAGSATIEGFAQPFDFSVQAGSLRASGRLAEGESRIQCDAGSVALALERGSSVRIRTRSTMGKVELPGGASTTGDRRAQESIVGDGAASLVIQATMGNVRVAAGV
jgi:hypothetical protein